MLMVASGGIALEIAPLKIDPLEIAPRFPIPDNIGHMQLAKLEIQGH